MKTFYDMTIVKSAKGYTVLGGATTKVGNRGDLYGVDNVSLINMMGSHLQIGLHYTEGSFYVCKTFIVSLTPRGAYKDVKRAYCHISTTKGELGDCVFLKEENVALRINGKKVKASANYNEEE